ncbi:MAG: hypothetical protein ACYC7E_23005 [Armatimonadota bacterium]
MTDVEGDLLPVGLPDDEDAPPPSPESAAVQSAVRKMAESKPEKLMEFMAMGMSSVSNPLHSKMTTEHISAVLDLAAKHDERQYDLSRISQDNDFTDGKSNRWYCFLAFAVILVFTGYVIYIFKNKTDVLIPILTGLGGLLSGFLAGLGWGKKQK